MDNIINPAGQVRSVSHRGSRWARLWIAVVAAGVAAGTVRAQTSYSVGTLAGQPNSPGAVDAIGAAARFRDPASVVADSSGNLYVADTTNHAVRKVVVSTGAVTTVAGLLGTSGTADGAGTVARFNLPQGLALDAGANKLYVSDTFNHTIRVIDLAPSTPVVSTLAGGAGTTGSTNATGTAARFNYPYGLALSGGNLYVADSSNQSIRKIVVASGVVTTLAGPDGTGSNTPGTQGFVDSATPASVRFFNPIGLAADNANLYVADKSNNRIRKVVLATGEVTTLAGAATAGAADGTGATASFNGPEGLAINSNGSSPGTTLLVADTLNHTVRRVVIATGVVTTLAGTAGSGSFADGLGTLARFTRPTGIALDSASNLYVADNANQLIRRGTVATAPAITSANNATFSLGGLGSFSFTATGSPAPTFSITAGGLPAGVNLSSAGVLSGVPATAVGSPFSVTVQASNGVAPAATQVFTLTVNQPPVITSAATTTFVVGNAATYQVVATGSPAPTFSITAGSLPATVAFMNPAGLITAAPPSTTAGSPFTFTITATNTGGSTTQVFTLNVSSGPTISTQPAAATVAAGAGAQYSVVAAANGGGVLTYQWQRQASGTIGFVPLIEGGKYTGTTTATLTVSPTALADSGDKFQVVVSSGVGSPATSNEALLTITTAPTITSLPTVTLVENQAGTFTVLATGAPSTITYSVFSGTLPSGLTLNAGTGVLSGTPAVGTSAASPYNLVLSASNGVNPDALQPFTLVISPVALAPVITTQPANVALTPGQVASFTVAATGNPTPTIQWQRLPAGASAYYDLANDTTYSGVTTGTLTVLNPTSSMSGDAFRAVATNTSGSAQSLSASLSIVVGTAVSTYVGSPGASGTTDGTGDAARFNGPAGTVVDALGNLYVADTSNHVIRKVAPGGVVTTLAGQPGVSGSADGVGSAARFNSPSGVAVSTVGTVYVADTYNHTVRAIAPDGTVTTVAGLAGNTGSTDGTGSAARFLYPYGVAVDTTGTIYVADTFNHTIRRIQSGAIVTTYAGTAGQRGTTDALGVNARFAFPFAVVADAAGAVFVADSFNHTIRKIDFSSNVSTLAGTGGTSGVADGTGAVARFNQPSALAVDSGGNVYVADTNSHTLRRITSTGTVSTLAGTAGTAGSADGLGSAARFNQPFGVAVDSQGTIFITDTRNHVIKRTGNVGAPTITTQPVAAVTPVGGSATFTVAATGTPVPSVFTWYRLPVGSTGYVPILTNDATYSGVGTATLRITNAAATMTGDQFQVVVSNLISPNATSNPVSLTVGTAPTITSAAAATFRAGTAGSFTFTATGDPVPTFAIAGLPAWASLNATTGVLSGTPPDTTGSPLTLTVTATNPAVTTQSFTLTIQPAVTAPAIATQPQAAVVDLGGTLALSVGATGTEPLAYQWSRDGAALNGAVGATLTLSGVQASAAGSYTVQVTNSIGTVTSVPANVVVTTLPVLTQQPRPQVAFVGASATFAVSATGGSSFNYQWRRNGLNIGGATASTLTLSNVSAGDTGFYDVLVANARGTATSSVATLTVVSAPQAPVISAQPSAQVVSAGRSATLTVGVSAAPSPTFQWRRNGAAIAGATTAAYVAGESGSYDVVITNSAGSVTSRAAAVRVLTRSYAGTYFGAFGGGAGGFALLVRPDNTAVFLGYPGTAPLMNLNFNVTDSGAFAFSQNSFGLLQAVVAVSGTIGTDGTVTGAASGGLTGTFAGNRATDVGATQGVAGYYQSGATAGAAVAHVIAGPAAQAFALVQSGSVSDGGVGTVTAVGQVSVLTTRSVISATINAATGLVTGTSTGVIAASFIGGSESAVAAQRLVNISSRARVSSGEGVAIAGFVISGGSAKPVLIRAVGPTLGSVFGLPGSLASPRLELVRSSDQASLGVNAGIAADRAAIDAAGARAGAFALGASGADAALLTTLAPGAYTAVVSSTNNAAGIALIEVYDLSGASPGQKLLNIATRASAGAGDNTLIAGFVVPPGAAKRVLVRGVGPGLAQFGVAGVLAQPTLQLLSGSTSVAQNTNWTTSVDRDAIATSSASVGAFGLAANDSAVILTLAPGNYTAQVTGPGAATGIALIEVYELP